MKINTLFLLSIFCVTSLSAMDNGINVVDSTSFLNALKIGTKKTLATWVADNKVDLNTRCIKVVNHIGSIPYMYPIEYVLCVQHKSAESLNQLLNILIELEEVPVDGYEDFNPLLYMLGSEKSLEEITVLYNLGADPKKQIMYFGKLQSPQEYLEWKIEVERVQVNKNDKRIAQLGKIRALFVSKREQNNDPVILPSSMTPILSNQNDGTVVQPIANASSAQSQTTYHVPATSVAISPDNQASTRLYQAIAEGDLATVRQLFQNKQVSVDSDLTVVGYDSFDVMKVLENWGDNGGRSEYEEAITSLIQKYVHYYPLCLPVTDLQASSIAHQHSIQPKPVQFNPLEMALDSNQLDVMRVLVDEFHWDINKKKNPNLLTVISRHAQRPAMAKYLIDKGIIIEPNLRAELQQQKLGYRASADAIETIQYHVQGTKIVCGIPLTRTNVLRGLVLCVAFSILCYDLFIKKDENDAPDMDNDGQQGAVDVPQELNTELI